MLIDGFDGSHFCITLRLYWWKETSVAYWHQKCKLYVAIRGAWYLRYMATLPWDTSVTSVNCAMWWSYSGRNFAALYLVVTVVGLSHVMYLYRCGAHIAWSIVKVSAYYRLTLYDRCSKINTHVLKRWLSLHSWQPYCLHQRLRWQKHTLMRCVMVYFSLEVWYWQEIFCI